MKRQCGLNSDYHIISIKASNPSSACLSLVTWNNQALNQLDFFPTLLLYRCSLRPCGKRMVAERARHHAPLCGVPVCAWIIKPTMSLTYAVQTFGATSCSSCFYFSIFRQCHFMGGTLLLEDVSQIKQGLPSAAGGKMATQRVSSSLSEPIST